MTDTGKSRIRSIEIVTTGTGESEKLIARDHETALRDLKTGSFFQPHNDTEGPYDLTLTIEDSRLVFKIRGTGKAEMPMLVLSLRPYKRLIKDYFIIVQSYEKALREGQPSRIEAIDMGRRGVHNEGAWLLMERLDGKIKMDMDTARRLFTLICVLQANAPLAWR
jgi:uncharacterized protein (UPF0262 family)